MIVNVRHTGIVVSNIERSKSFYQELGFTLFASDTEIGDFIDKVTGLRNIELEWVKMKSVDGFVLELIQYHSCVNERIVGNIKPNRLGYSHIAITVNNAVEVCKVIESLGGHVINLPATSKNGEVKVSYCYDPEGIMLEIVEEL